jgi:hypothetical protein
MPTYKIKHKIVGDVRYSISGGSLTLLDNWDDKNIVTVNIPALKGVDVGGGKVSSGNVRWYKGATYQLEQAFKEIEEKGLAHLILSYAGSFYPRPIRGTTSTPSEHSFGTALDINAAWNGLNREPAKAGTKGSVRELVAIFEKWGFRWGGYFKRFDGMHFEVARIIPRPTTTAATSVNHPKQWVVNEQPLFAARIEDGKLIGGIKSFADAIGYELHMVEPGILRAWKKEVT